MARDTRRTWYIAVAIAAGLTATCTDPASQPLDACRPSTCATLAIGCGMTSDGCGGMLNCGGCDAPMTCGGAGVAHQCGNPASRTCSAAGWCAEPIPHAVTAGFNGVWGASGNDLWVVGDLGTVLRWDGTAWSILDAGIPPAPDGGAMPHLRAVWGAAAGDVWIVGDAGTLLHWDGSRVAAMPSGVMTGLRGVWGAAANDVWAVGDRGVLLHWNGTAWAAAPSGVTRDLRGVWGLSANDVWVVGAGGTTLHWTGSAWMPFPGMTFEVLNAVWGTSANDVWAVGERGVIDHWNGTAWMPTTITIGMATDGGPPPIYAGIFGGVWGSAPNDVWIAGSYMATVSQAPLAHWDGMAWMLVQSGTTEDLVGVWGQSAADVWTVGRYGTVQRRRQ